MLLNAMFVTAGSQINLLKAKKKRYFCKKKNGATGLKLDSVNNMGWVSPGHTSFSLCASLKNCTKIFFKNTDLITCLFLF